MVLQSWHRICKLTHFGHQIINKSRSWIYFLTVQSGSSTLALIETIYYMKHYCLAHYKHLRFSRYSWTQYFTVSTGLNILMFIMLQCKHSYYFYIILCVVQHLDLFQDFAMKGCLPTCLYSLFHILTYFSRFLHILVWR